MLLGRCPLKQLVFWEGKAEELSSLFHSQTSRRLEHSSQTPSISTGPSAKSRQENSKCWAYTILIQAAARVCRNGTFNSAASGHVRSSFYPLIQKWVDCLI